MASSLAFTLDVDSHVTDTLQQQATDAMDALLARSSTSAPNDPNGVGVNVGVNEQTRQHVDTRIRAESNSKQAWSGGDSNP